MLLAAFATLTVVIVPAHGFLSSDCGYYAIIVSLTACEVSLRELCLEAELHRVLTDRGIALSNDVYIHSTRLLPTVDSFVGQRFDDLIVEAYPLIPRHLSLDVNPIVPSMSMGMGHVSGFDGFQFGQRLHNQHLQSVIHTENNIATVYQFQGIRSTEKKLKCVPIKSCVYETNEAGTLLVLSHTLIFGFGPRRF